MKNSKKWVKFKSYLPFYFLMIPGLIYLFCNNYLPMVGLWMAFTKVNLSQGIFAGDFIGFANFRFLVNSHDFFLMIRNITPNSRKNRKKGGTGK